MASNLTGKENPNDESTIRSINNLNPKQLGNINNIKKIANIFEVDLQNENVETIVSDIMAKISADNQYKKDYKNFLQKFKKIKEGLNKYNICKLKEFNPDDIATYAKDVLNFLESMESKFFNLSKYSKMVQSIKKKANKVSSGRIENAFMANSPLDLFIIRKIKNYLEDKSNSSKRAIPLNKLIKELKKVNSYRTNMVLGDSNFSTDEQKAAYDKRTFKGSKNIGYLELPDIIKIIHKDFFKDSTVTKLTINHKVQRIESGAFENCQELKKIDGKGEIEKIEDHAFRNCSNLKTIADTLKGFYDKNGNLKNPKAFEGCLKLLKEIETKTSKKSSP